MNEIPISELAAQSGVPSTTLRYYEQIGLLAADRTPSGYRIYDERAVERVRFIIAAKRMQLSLDSVGELLPAWETEPCRSVKARLRPMVSSRLTDAEQDIAALNDLAAELRSGLERLDALPERDDGCDPSCAFLDVAPTSVELASDGGGCGAAGDTAARACSLTGADRAERIARWHSLLASAQLTTIHLGVICSLPVELRGELVELVAAEQQCCPFLSFRLDFLGSCVDLHITAPREDALPFIEALLSPTPVRRTGAVAAAGDQLAPPRSHRGRPGRN
jgi:DNA-binding transcriptional MerR regulator